MLCVCSRFRWAAGYQHVEIQKGLEKYLIAKGGFVALYAETHLSRDDFYGMFGYNLKVYDRVRKELGCDKAFPHVYDKISKAARG